LRDSLGESRDQVLLVKNDSAVRATGVLGLIVRPEKAPKYLRNAGLFLSATFSQTQGSEETVGVFWGISYRLFKNVNLFGGWSRKRGEELSYGFTRGAIQYVKDNPNNETLQRLYANELVLNPRSKELNRKYDGFRINQDFKLKYFAGSPVIESYNSAFVFGVAIPLKLVGELGGPK